MLQLNKTIIKLAEISAYKQNKHTKQNSEKLQSKLARLQKYFRFDEKTNTILFFACHCKKNLILRHTEFNKTAGEVIAQFPYTTNSTCTNDNHSFSNLKAVRCKNYTSTIRSFNMFAYAYRDILMDTKYEAPQSHIAKCLNLTRPISKK